MKRLRHQNGPLDALDVALLEALAKNGRARHADLARVVGLTAPSVAERIKRLEEAGVIAGYAARIDAAALGLTLSAYIRVRPMPGELARAAAVIDALPEIVSCDRVTGDDCFIARAHVRSVAELEAVIDKIIPYATTHTSIIQSSIVRERPPVFSAGAA